MERARYSLVYSLIFLKKAKDELQKIDPIWQKRIKAKLEILAKNPIALSNKILPLKGKQFKGLARLRVGHYRIIFQKKDEELIILIVRITHGGFVYR
ncbi:MAG: type II toxin-antitoxin system RelE/ParE family toxin [Candidatus Marinimicrobia bacterium]|nr:type II toxin-antitoxin system RelE/ParE family toxin [Candidatus Neomarinimicrobiota bacterium]